MILTSIIMDQVCLLLNFIQMELLRVYFFFFFAPGIFCSDA